jgi:cell division transport system ATP-binding protein
MSMIQFRNVGFRYPDNIAETLVDLNFSIEAKSFQFLTGPSGAGKTTLLRLMLMMLLPTRGTLTLFSQNVNNDVTPEGVAALRRRIGIVFQENRLLDHLTVYENVSLPLLMLGKNEADYREEVVELLQWVGLGERMEALPSVISGGEKQRTAIARAVIARPQLLLADEPTGNVDPNLGQRLLRLFIELNKSGTTIVIATHDLELMDEFDARRLVLSERRVHIHN